MSRLSDILDIVSASGENSDDVLLELLQPEKMTREEAQVVFDDSIGYDPTTYFDKRDIAEHVEALIVDDLTPANISTLVAEDKSNIVDSAFDKFDESRQEYLADAVAEAVYDATGWELDPSDEEDNAEEESDDYDE